MATTDEAQALQNSKSLFSDEVGHPDPRVNSLRIHVKQVADGLRRSDPDNALSGYLQRCVRDLDQFKGKRLQGPKEAPGKPRLQVPDILLSFVTISKPLEAPIDQRLPNNVDFGTFLEEFNKVLLQSEDLMMSIWYTTFVSICLQADHYFQAASCLLLFEMSVLLCR